jgi:hypothetical protein
MIEELSVSLSSKDGKNGNVLFPVSKSREKLNTNMAQQMYLWTVE